ncbi:hypothetical protein [uncultured Pseudoteredinibacter sp.]|uniref:hypothetical protein n=1 Tax=uncultured Pseudoteredinibacter sp. TaxID=1641701 RepID=UPI002623AE54|nr:hypothetical protein [uncultured Pseudoteredinibacter sp.]
MINADLFKKYIQDPGLKSHYIDGMDSKNFAGSIVPKEIIDKGYVDKRTKLQKYFIEHQLELEKMKLKEQYKNERLAMILSVVLVLVTILTVFLAPEGKEIISYWVGGALILVIAGILGYTKLSIRSGETKIAANKA